MGGQGGWEWRIKAFVKIKKKEGGVGSGGWREGEGHRRVGGGGEGGCEGRSKVFVKIQKKKIEGEEGGSGSGGVPIRGWGGGGWVARFGRWVMWGMGDVNQE